MYKEHEEKVSGRVTSSQVSSNCYRESRERLALFS